MKRIQTLFLKLKEYRHGFKDTNKSDNPTKLDIGLQTKIKNYILQKREEGVLEQNQEIAFLVNDITDEKKLVSINEDKLFQCASMAKPLIALAFFHKVADEKIIYGQRSRQNMEAMIQESSNRAANWIIEQIGGIYEVNRILKKDYNKLLGKTKIIENIPLDGKSYKNMSCASDYARFLFALWNDKLPYSQEIKRLMALPKKNCFITFVENIPQDTLVYSKTGSNAYICGDMGIVCPKGKEGIEYPYIIIGLLQRKNPFKGDLDTWWDWLGTQRNVIRGVSNIVYNFMKEKQDLLVKRF